MYVQTIDNKSRKMLATLSSAIEQSSDTRIAVAFLSRRGVQLIEPAINSALDKNADVEFLVGLDRRVTEPGALLMLYQLAYHQPKLQLYCYISPSSAELYHPKVYLTRNERETTAIVGSSNLTVGGLQRNSEINVAIVGSSHDEAIADIYHAYYRLKFAPERVEPDEEFLHLYKEACDWEKRTQREESSSPVSQEFEQQFNAKKQSLQRPRLQRKDLVGWLDLVYDRLPDGEFTTQDSYALESDLQEFYPTNLHIRAKIRQKLQELRDLGFLEHVASGRWRKL